jgi:hypothetical protein
MATEPLPTTVIGVVRSATALDELVHRTLDAAPGEAPWRLGHVCELRRLDDRARPELSQAWAALSSVTTGDARTLSHVLTVLRETVPAPDRGDPVPPLRATLARPSPPRATAAHPRAYRGTHSRPPRPRAPASLGVAVGEHPGYLFSGAWTTLSGVALTQTTAVPSWLGVVGSSSGRR